ncbi:hypothetical protein [Amaricoccus sp.]|uniref:alpha/beta hydrolase family esterase n=1 Tax=Amaricoccus sp. TaxID=1872485 RepID=UPI00262A917A|nr:hypothetical protein [uncultured Amaricoccus sp.]
MITTSVVAGLALLAGASAMAGEGGAYHVADGDYRVEMPPARPARGAYVFFHGYNGSAAATLRDARPLVEMALAHGLAFVAVNGRDGTWSLPGSPAEGVRDEQAFITEVLDDLDARFGFSAAEIVLGGFSLGASMAWYTVCHQGRHAAGMITFSGVFWEPPPKPGDCDPTVPPVVHFHGRADRTFPLAGRVIGGRYHQGDTFASMAILRDTAGCDLGPGKPLTLAGISCEAATGCARGAIVLCLHDGGHQTDPDQLDAGLDEIGFRR